MARLDPETRAKVLDDLRADLKIKDIVKRHGVAKKTVYDIARGAGLPPRNAVTPHRTTTKEERQIRDDAIERLYLAGVPYKEIVATLGVTWGMIPRVVKARALPMREAPRHQVYLTRKGYADRHAMMQEMRAEGLAISDIAQRLELSVSAVSAALKGVPRGSARATIRTAPQIVALYEAGESIKHIVTTCGVSHPVIYQALHAAGVPLRKRTWTGAEDQVLGTDLPDEVIAEVLVRSIDAVRIRRAYLKRRTADER